MTRKQVSEKTLELNISSEILTMARKHYPKAYFIGPTNRQEWYRGYDDRLGGVKKGTYLIFQYKAPWANFPPNIFSINVRQHNILERKSRAHPDGVWYIFPPYQTFRKLWTRSPNLISETYFVRPSAIGLLPSTRNYFRLLISSPAKLFPGNGKNIEVIRIDDFKRIVFEPNERNGTTDIRCQKLLNINDIKIMDEEMQEFGLIWRGMQIFCLSEEQNSNDIE